MTDKPTPDSDTNGPPPETGDKPSGKTFTQADLDRLIDERLKRERAKYEDYPKLKEQAKQWQEHEDAQKSELEKLQTKLDAETAARERAESRAKSAFVQSSAMSELAAKGVPPDRLKAAFRLLDADGLKVEDDGTVNGVTDAVDKLLKENAFLLVNDNGKAAQPAPKPGQKSSPANPATVTTPGNPLMARVKELQTGRSDPFGIPASSEENK